MSCLCKKKGSDAPTDYSTLPDGPCPTCGEKHFATAFALSEEFGYVPVNRQRIVGELVCAAWHIYRDFPAIAEKLRDLRHKVQARREPSAEEWREVCTLFEVLLKPDPARDACSGRIFTDFDRTIWIISNVPAPSDAVVQAGAEDLLVFLNKAVPAKNYGGRKLCFHRSPEKNYGDDADRSMTHLYCFPADKEVPHVPKAFIDDLKKSYDWNYPIEEDKTRSMTTGYMTAWYLRHVFPNAEIILVNFGFKVAKSSYRCPWHNWRFEDGALEKFKHVYTVETTESSQ